MTEAKEKDNHQQQILFAEEELTLKDELPLSTQPIVFDNQDWQPAAEPEPEADEFLQQHAQPNWLLRILLTSFMALVGIESYDFFTTGFINEPITTSLMAVITVCIVFMAGTVFFRELTGLKQFKRQALLQNDAANILKNKSGDAVALCQQINQKLPCDVVAEKELEWQNIEHQDYQPDELVQLYSRMVLTEVDQKALNEIAKFSTESVVLIALSPIAIVDMAIILWRNFKLIDKIAGIYGIKLGYWSRIRLIKHVLVNIAYAGASELVADFGTDLLGADMLGKLSGRLAQGVGAGMLTARLGLKTMKLCRPIPFDSDVPKVTDVKKQIAEKIKQLLVKPTN